MAPLLSWMAIAPPASPASLPEKLDPVIVTTPSMLPKMAPPQSSAELSVNVEFVTVSESEAITAPASSEDTLWSNTESLIVMGPLPRTAPPSLDEPWTNVRPEIVTAEPPVTSKTRELSLPEMVSAVAPGPVNVRSLLKAMSPEVNVMLPVTWKSMVSPELAAATWARSDPAPVSFVVVTCSVVAAPAASTPGPIHVAPMARAALPAVSAAPTAWARSPFFAASRRSARLRGETS